MKKMAGILFAWAALPFLPCSISGAATSSAWTGNLSSDFNAAGNWDNSTVPTDIATFGPVALSSISLSGDASLNGFTFVTGAPTYTISNPTGVLSFNGSGIVNHSGQTPQLMNSGTIVLNNSASAGMATIQLNKSAGPGTLIFNNTATAENALIKPQDFIPQTPLGTVQFNDGSNAGHAVFTRSTVPNNLTGSLNIQFNDHASAANATITGNSMFDGTTTADHATFQNQNSSVGFKGFSNAGMATINNPTSNYNFVTFLEQSNASSATITSSGAANYIQFADAAGAGRSTISSASSKLIFFGDATAQNATIINSGSGTDSRDAGTCQYGSSSILNLLTNATFCNTSTAGSSIISNSGSTITRFLETTSAQDAVITNNDASSTTFRDTSNAGHATIVNTNASASTNFFDTANAGSAFLTNAGAGNIVQFNNSSNAGQATITNNGGGLVQFNDTSSGGEAAIVNASGTVNISNLNLPALSFGSISGGGNFVLGSKNLTVGGNDQDTEVSGVISGIGGSIIKVGTGTLTFSGNNLYTGGTLIQSGTLAITGDTSLGALAGPLTLTGQGILQTDGQIQSSRAITLNNGGIVNTNGFDSSLSGDILGTGSLFKIGAGTLTLSGANSYGGGTAIEEGVLRTGSTNALPHNGAVVVGDGGGATLDLNGFDQNIGSLFGDGSVLLGTATLTTGSDNSAGAFSGSMTGSGSLVKVGSGTLTLSEGKMSGGGNVVVDGGNLIFVEAPGAPAAGLGAIASLVNKSVVTPGIQGVGTLHVSNYSGPGILNISFDGSAHTSLIVDSTATLTSGTLAVSGSRFASGRYNVLTAGTRDGTFANVIAPPPSVFLTLSTEYTPNDVQLLVTALNFSDVAQNGNERGVAAVLDAARPAATGDAASAIESIYALGTADQARAAYRQISGDSIASLQNSGLRGAEVFTRQMTGRTTPSRFANATNLTPPVPAYGLWSRGLGFFDQTDANSSIGSPASRATTGGFQVGYDFVVAEDVVFGLSGGYAKTSVSVDERASSGNSTSYQSGIYTSYNPGAWFVSGSLAYTTASNDMTRSIQFPGISEQANADFQSRIYTGYVEGGYRYQPMENLSVEPSLSLKESHLDQEAFTESGAPGLNLSVREQKVNSVVSAVGARIAEHFRAKSAHPITLGLRAAWEHELGDADNSITAQFAEAPAGGPFTVQATPRSRNAAALGFDGRVNVSHELQGFADYSATLSSGQNSQAIFGGLSLKW